MVNKLGPSGIRVWRSLPRSSKIFLGLCVLQALIAGGFSLQALIRVTDPTLTQDLVAIQVTAAFFFFLVLDAFYQENAYQLIACMAAALLSLVQLILYATSWSKSTQHDDVALAAVAACAVLQLLILILARYAYLGFGWRMYSRIPNNILLPDADKIYQAGLRLQRFVAFAKFHLQLTALLFTVGLVNGINPGPASTTPVLPLLLGIAGVGCSITLGWLVVSWYAVATAKKRLRLAAEFAHPVLYVLAGAYIMSGAHYGKSGLDELGQTHGEVGLIAYAVLFVVGSMAVWWDARLLSAEEKGSPAGGVVVVTPAGEPISPPDLTAAQQQQQQANSLPKELMPLVQGAWLLKLPNSSSSFGNKAGEQSPLKRPGSLLPSVVSNSSRGRWRFFQLSHDGSTLRWDWRKYVLLVHVEEVVVCAEDLTITLRMLLEPDLRLKFEDGAMLEEWGVGLKLLLRLLGSPDGLNAQSMSHQSSLGSMFSSGPRDINRSSSILSSSFTDPGSPSRILQRLTSASYRPSAAGLLNSADLHAAAQAARHALRRPSLDGPPFTHEEGSFTDSKSGGRLSGGSSPGSQSPIPSSGCGKDAVGLGFAPGALQQQQHQVCGVGVKGGPVRRGATWLKNLMVGGRGRGRSKGSGKVVPEDNLGVVSAAAEAAAARGGGDIEKGELNATTLNAFLLQQEQEHCRRPPRTSSFSIEAQTPYATPTGVNSLAPSPTASSPSPTSSPIGFPQGLAPSPTAGPPPSTATLQAYPQHYSFNMNSGPLKSHKSFDSGKLMGMQASQGFLHQVPYVPQNRRRSHSIDGAAPGLMSGGGGGQAPAWHAMHMPHTMLMPQNQGYSPGQQHQQHININHDASSGMLPPMFYPRATWPHAGLWGPGPDGGTSSRSVSTIHQETVDMEELTFGRLLGQGAEGPVHAAWFRDTPVAVKRLRRTHEVDMHQHAGSHDNVVGMRAVAHTGQYTYLIMELCARGTLDVMIHQSTSPRMEPMKLLPIVRSIARGMLHLHTRSPPLLHRDLKPANVFVGAGLVMKIGDFGMARLATDTRSTRGWKNSHDGESNKSSSYSELEMQRTLTPGVIGTAAYCAPELLAVETPKEGTAASDKGSDGQGVHLDILKADVYSFGVLVWELCERQRPHDGIDGFQVQTLWLLDPEAMKLPPLTMPEGMDEGSKRVMQTLADIVVACTAWEPAERPSFREILATLRTAAAEASRE